MNSESRRETQAAREMIGVNWANGVFLIVAHVAAVAALFFWSWTAVITAVIFYWIAGSLGIGMGYHRLLTHRGYKVPRAVEYFLAVCGTLALEGGPIQWVVTHRIHHAHADREGDPHTPRDGRLWSHIGWVLRGRAQRHEESVLWHYAPDLMKDRFYIWLNRLFFIPLILVGAALLAFGGWKFILWAVFMRATLALHATWLVNSATHLWGKR